MPVVQDLPGALVIVGKTAISVVCVQGERGHEVVLSGGVKSIVVLLPDEVLKAAIGIEQAFDGAIVEDPTGSIWKAIGGN